MAPTSLVGSVFFFIANVMFFVDEFNLYHVPEKYRDGEASLGRAAELAGIPVGQMMTLLSRFGVESRIDKEDYLQGAKHLEKVL